MTRASLLLGGAFLAATVIPLAAGCNSARRAEPSTKNHQNEPQVASPPVAAPSTAAATVPAATLRHGAVSNDGQYFVAYTPHPDPIPLNQLFELTVRVYAASDRSRPLHDVTLNADAAMPDHDHGMNTRPRVRPGPDGSFRVAGMQFHMPGHWELYFDVTRGGITERAQFDVQLD